jgi:hypothetical protein
MLNDILINLATELIGIIITVFIVDRLLQYRENAKWKKVKDFALSRIYREIDSFMFRSGFDMLGYRYTSPQLLHWGKTKLYSSISYQTVTFDNVLKCLDNNVVYSEAAIYFKSQEIIMFRQVLYSTIDLTGQFLNPQIYDYSARIDEQIGMCVCLIDDSNKDLKFSIATTICLIIKLRNIIEKLSSKIEHDIIQQNEL